MNSTGVPQQEMDEIQQILEYLQTPTALEIIQILKSTDSKVRKKQLFQLIREFYNTSVRCPLQGIRLLKQENKNQKQIIESYKALIKQKNELRYDMEEGFSLMVSNLCKNLSDSFPGQQLMESPKLKDELKIIANLQRKLQKAQKELISFEQNQDYKMDKSVQNIPIIEDDQFYEMINLKIQDIIKKGDELRQAVQKFQHENKNELINYGEITKYCELIKRLVQANNEILSKLKINFQNLLNNSKEKCQNVIRCQEDIKKMTEENQNLKKEFDQKNDEYKVKLEKLESDLKNAKDQYGKKLMLNKEVAVYLQNKWTDFQNGLKEKIYVFNQAIIKNLINVQIYFLTPANIDKIKQQSFIAVQDLEKISKQPIPKDFKQLQYNIQNMTNLKFLSPGQDTFKAFQTFVKDVGESIEGYYHF